jgi:hypothetical protein
MIHLSQTDWERSRNNIRSQQVRDRGVVRLLRVSYFVGICWNLIFMEGGEAPLHDR